MIELLNTNETWLTVPETSGRYEVSSLGRIRNTESGRILAQREHLPRDKRPYMRCDLFPPGEGTKAERKRSLYVHRLIAAVFLYGTISLPDEIEIHHKDGNRKNNRATNLDGLTVLEHKSEHSEAALADSF